MGRSAASNAHARAQAAYKARRRAERQREAVAAVVAVVPPDRLAETFLEDVLTWSAAQPGAVARTVGLTAADQLDALAESAEPDRLAKLRALAEREGIPGAIESADDAARRAALTIVAQAHAAIRAGTAIVAEVRAGLRASKVLARRRSRLNEDSVGQWLTRIIVNTPTPAWVTGDDNEGDDHDDQ